MSLDIRRLLVLCMAFVVFFALAVQPSASAISSTALKAIQARTPWYGEDGEAKAGCGISTDTGQVELSGGDAQQIALNFFESKGLNDIQSAAIIGNLMQESRLRPKAYNPPSPPGNPDGHRGIAQWNDPPAGGGRWGALVTQAKSKGLDEFALGTQLEYVWIELSGAYSSVLDELKAATTIEQATKIIDDRYEVSGGGEIANRIEFAKKALADYGGSATGAITGSTASCGSVGAVDCSATSESSGTSGLSQVRQNVVCLAEGELALWTSGKMTTGGDFKKYSGGVDAEWCAYFASWIYNQAKYPLINTESGSVSTVSSIRDIGIEGTKFTYHTSDTWIPKPGDLVIQKHDHDPVISHVMIVVSVNENNSSITVIGGNQNGTSSANTSSKVTKYTIQGYASDYIVGYVSPME